MNVDSNIVEDVSKPLRPSGHRLWVRLTHWAIAAAIAALIYSGVAILMVHPRLYWGNTGNNLTPPWIEVPLGPNYHQGRWGPAASFFETPHGPTTASRLDEPWNKNSWARSLHFLAAWVFLIGLLAYFTIGIITGHARRNILPQRAELGGANLWSDLKAHLRLPFAVANTGPPYGIIQKLAYATLVFLALPLMFLTGITMSPAITADFPLLLDISGGTQSARTLHFIAFTFVALFLVAHLVMVIVSGPFRQLRGMIVGR